MKTQHSTSLLAILGAGIGCQSIADDLNVDPNNPLETRPDLVLPGVQTSYGFHLHSDIGRFTSIWSQQLAGNGGLHRFFERYGILPSDMDNVWTALYADVLQELRLLNQLADETGNPQYRGVSNVLEAALGMTLVDAFNDVPWTQAAQGGATFNSTPTFTPGEQIYQQVDSLLEAAVVQLNLTAGPQTIGSDDLVYAGNLDQWRKLAYSLMLRSATTRSMVNSDTYVNLIQLLNNDIIVSNEDNALVKFSNNSPLFAFQRDRAEVVAGETLVTLMQRLSDPRLQFYFTEAGNEEFPDSLYIGQPAGNPSSIMYSRIGPAWASATSPVAIMTAAEVRFIEAEAALQTGDEPRAVSAYQAGVRASLEYHQVPAMEIDTYVANLMSAAGAITLEAIATQKYIALFPHPQAFTEWRRTGIPVLQAARGRDEVARRLPYPDSERNYNSDNFTPYVATTVYDRVFWDVD